MTQYSATFTISLTYAVSSAFTVNYTTVDGTAKAGVDYTATSGSVTFNPGDTSHTVSVPIIAYVLSSEAPNFTLKLSSTSNSVYVGNNGICTLSAPKVTITEGPIIGNYLTANSYANENGRGDYIQYNGGSSEGQSIMIYGLWCAYDAIMTGLGNAPTDSPELSVAQYFKSLAQNLLDAMGPSATNEYEGPLIRQPIPTNPETLFIPHWLFTAKGTCPVQEIAYTYTATLQNDASGYYLTIGTDGYSSSVYLVYEIYPSTSTLQYHGTWTPAFDSQGNNTAITIDASATEQNWTTQSDGTVRIPLPASADTSIKQWNIVYAYEPGTTIPEGTAQEAYPCWTEIADGYVACAPDTLRWFDFAYQSSIKFDDRDGMVEKWTNSLNALRWSTVKGKIMRSDQTVFYQLPGQPALPGPSNAPYGIYCFSTNPDAGIPDTSTGFPSSWTGYRYWSRDADGNYQLNVSDNTDTKTVYQYQIGRGQSFEWRETESYQYPTQYLYSKIAISRAPDPTKGESVQIMAAVSMANIPGDMFFYDLTSEFTADNSSIDNFVTSMATNSQLVTSQNTANPTWTLPVGSTLARIEVIFNMIGDFEAKVEEVAFIGGPSATWVQQNLDESLLGDPIPFLPASTPFTYNGYVNYGTLITWRGQLMYGYQMPDIWHYYEDATNLVYASNPITADQLPVCNVRTGALEYTINPNNANGTPKPMHALLMEQQVQFLFTAQQRFQIDGGNRGAFSHCFLINNSDRFSLGLDNPQPNSWVYTSDDPNTKWSGYQTRVIESLARLVYENKDDDAFEDVVTLSTSILEAWFTLLLSVWPNLDGQAARNDDGSLCSPGYLVYGPPTYWVDPSISPTPLFNYEDVHPAALIARACMYMLMAGDTTMTSTYETILLNCWNYLEKFWGTNTDFANDMFYTWSTDPTHNSWFGFYNGEIFATLSLMYKNSQYLPTGIDPTVILERFMMNALWLQTVGVRSV